VQGSVFGQGNLDQPQTRVPHLHDSFIVVKMGIRATRERLQLFTSAQAGRQENFFHFQPSPKRQAIRPTHPKSGQLH
jgi:hypothetical protein